MLQIRTEQPDDIEVIAEVTRAAFAQADHASGTEPLIIAALRAARQLSLSLVAQANGHIVGHVAVSPVSISDGACGWHGLGPLSVLPAYQRNGVGGRLVREALSRLREEGACGCVVLGDPAYYSRFGFQPRPELVLPGVPPEYFQAMAFRSPSPSGTVAYHAAFEVEGI